MDKMSTEQDRPGPCPQGAYSLEHPQASSFRKWGVSKSEGALRVPSLAEVPQGSEELGGTIPANCTLWKSWGDGSLSGASCKCSVRSKELRIPGCGQSLCWLHLASREVGGLRWEREASAAHADEFPET